MKRYLFALPFMTLAFRSGWAVQHIVPGAYPNAVQDKMHHPSAARMRAAGGSLRAATIADASGTKNVAVIVVQFPAGDSSLRSGSNSIQSIANVQTYFTQLKNYYTEVSYGRITLNISYFNFDTAVSTGDATLTAGGVYTMTHPSEYYGCGDEGVGCSSISTPAQGANGNYLIRDAIILARGGHSGLQSTEVSGGIFDAIIVMHAGNGNETTQGKNGDIWSIFYSQDAPIIGGQASSDPQPVAQAAGFTEGDVVPETEANSISSPLGVMAHEFGHSLGLPDLYNTSAIGGSSVVGKWDIMDAGPYLNGGANPSHPCAWNKYTLGWVAPTIGTTKMTAALTYIETTQSLLKIPVQNGLPQEYFLVEYRSRTSGATYDRYIPGDGLLIWHVDDALTSSRGINAVSDQNTVNSGTPHYGVSLITADGASVASTGGASGNAFHDGRNFIPPASDNFNGDPSGISLVNISGTGSSTVSTQVANLAVEMKQAIVKVITYPNPAGKGYAHPSGAGHATLQLQLGRPATDLSANIYTVSGELVRKIGKDDFTLDLDRSTDNKWVYEFVWDLKNGNSAMVAPGVYLCLAHADGVSKSNKLVVIR